MPEPRVRRPIRSKVARAFALLALVPLVVLSVLASWSAVRYLRSDAEVTLEYDLELARLRAARSLRQVGQNLDFLTEAVLRERVESPSDGRVPTNDLAAVFLRTDSTAILRVKAIDVAGDLVFWETILDEQPAEAGGSGELFYLFQAEEALSDVPLFLPVELRAPGDAADATGVIPAIAILESIRSEEGEFLGVAVAEASLAALFEGLDLASPGFGGVTGLVDESGRFLYHSERKSDWASLLASQGSINLRTDFDDETAKRILSGETGTLEADDGSIVSYRPLARGDLDGPLLVLYRAVAPEALSRSVREFLILTGLVVLATLVLVSWMARRAADQLTEPLYRLGRAARNLARGEEREPIGIRTGDELEELAADFTRMADALAEQQRQLEEMVAVRTSALETTRSEFAQVVTHAADAIIGLDAAGRVRFWNEGAEGLLGYTEAEASDCDIDELIGRDVRAMERTLMRDALQRGETVANLLTQRTGKNGERFPVTLTQAPVTDERGQVVGASLVIRDHRAQSRIEEQMRHSERLAAASIMAAGLAHEINNPLAILQNRIELMQRETPEGSSLRHDLDVLLAHVERLRGITSDLLAFAKEESAGSAHVRVDALARRLLSLLARIFLTEGVALQEEIEAVPPIRGNEKAIEAVLVNLLTNASQAAAPAGTVTLRIRHDEARERVRIAVEDTGPGVPRELQERIFEPFFTTKSGTGLGLTLCRTIVERHGGTLELDPAYQGGARFIVELPTLRS